MPCLHAIRLCTRLCTRLCISQKYNDNANKIFLFQVVEINVFLINMRSDIKDALMILRISFMFASVRS